MLERLERLGMVRLTRKASLLAAAASLPRAITDVTEGRIAPGYVASVTPDAVFVRFLAGLTGRAGAVAASSHGFIEQIPGALASDNMICKNCLHSLTGCATSTAAPWQLPWLCFLNSLISIQYLGISQNLQGICLGGAVRCAVLLCAS